MRSIVAGFLAFICVLSVGCPMGADGPGGSNDQGMSGGDGASDGGGGAGGGTGSGGSDDGSGGAGDGDDMVGPPRPGGSTDPGEPDGDSGDGDGDPADPGGGDPDGGDGDGDGGGGDGDGGGGDGDGGGSGTVPVIVTVVDSATGFAAPNFTVLISGGFPVELVCSGPTDFSGQFDCPDVAVGATYTVTAAGPFGDTRSGTVQLAIPASATSVQTVTLLLTP